MKTGTTRASSAAFVAVAVDADGFGVLMLPHESWSYEHVVFQATAVPRFDALKLPTLGWSHPPIVQ